MEISIYHVHTNFLIITYDTQVEDGGLQITI